MRSLRTNGARIAYQKVGDGPAVVLLQGVGLVGEGWRPQVEALARRFTLITIDNRGIGASTLDGGELSIAAMADDALAVADAEELATFHVVGHSMGGLIAQELALRAPRRVTSLALLCTFAWGKQGARPSLSMLGTALRTRIGTRRMRRHAFLELVLPKWVLATADRDALASALEPLFGHDLADSPPVVMQQLSAMSRYDARGRLAELAPIPTLVVVAAEDRIARPRFGRELAAAIPGARRVELADAAHGVPIHQPGRINDLLREHFAAAQSARQA